MQSQQSNNVPTMADMLELYGDLSPVKVSRGSLVEGTVLGHEGRLGYIVDFGGKIDGVLPRTEVDGELEIGTKSWFLVEHIPMDESESPVLSSRRARAWLDMIELKDKRGNCTVTVSRVAARRGQGVAGLNVTVNGIEGFIPMALLGFGPNKARELVRQQLVVKVAEVNPQTGRLIFDCGAVRREAEQARDARFTSLKKGDSITGTVVQKTDYGFFVDVGDALHGLLHNEEHNGSVLAVGDSVTARITRCERNPEGKRMLALSTQLPFMDRVQVGDVLTGFVRNIAAFGAFVRLSRSEQVDGLVHKSEMPEGDLSLSALNIRDTVTVRVVHVDRQARRISLSMKDVPSNG